MVVADRKQSHDAEGVSRSRRRSTRRVHATMDLAQHKRPTRQTRQLHHRSSRPRSAPPTRSPTTRASRGSRRHRGHKAKSHTISRPRGRQQLNTRPPGVLKRHQSDPIGYSSRRRPRRSSYPRNGSRRGSTRARSQTVVRVPDWARLRRTREEYNLRSTSNIKHGVCLRRRRPSN